MVKVNKETALNMEGSQQTAEPLGRMLGLLILFGIVVLKFVIIFLDKKWHGTVHSNVMSGVRDLPPLYSSQTIQSQGHDMERGSFRISNSFSVLSARQVSSENPHCSGAQGFGTNWILSKRKDFSDSSNISVFAS